MTSIFSAIIKASFQGSIVILAVMLLRLVLKKAPKSLFCLLWLLAGLRLALPFEIQSSLSLQPDYSFSTEDASLRAEILNQNGPVLVDTPEQATTPVPEQAPAVLPEGNWEDMQTEALMYTVEDGVITGPLTWTDIAAQIWVLGVAFMLGASVVSYLRLKRRVREAYLIENGCFECPGLETAFVLGFLSPRIYLPTGLSDREKAFIYDHENTHIARHDHWFKLLGYAVLSIHWFNPLVWMAYGLLSRDMELACDEHVVRNMTLPERKAYSEALLSCSGHSSRFAACPVAFGESDPKKRILNVLHYKRPTFWISLLAVIAVVFVSVCLLTSPAAEQPPEETDAGSWNLEMKVTDVTPTGLTMEFTQTGEFPGWENTQLQYGSAYSLQVFRDGQWTDVELASPEESSTWNMIAYLIELNGTTTHNVNWQLRYGQLTSGHYRIGKAVSLFRGAGDYDEQTLFAEFSIEDTISLVPSETVPGTVQDIQETITRCREAMNAIKASEELYLYIVNLNDPNAVANTYIRTSQGWIFRYRRPGWDYTDVTWLRYGQEQYLFAGDQNEDGIMTAPYYWQVEPNPDSHNFQLPYPFDLDWETISLNYQGTQEDQGETSVTLTYPDYLDVFTFRFNSKGDLLWFDVGDSTGEPEATTSRFYVQYPWGDTVENHLETEYKLASGMAGRKPEPYIDSFYLDLFTRETDGTGTSMWISELFDVFYQDAERFVARLAVLDSMDSEAAGRVIIYLSQELSNHAPELFEYTLSRMPEDYYPDMVQQLRGITTRPWEQEQQTIEDIMYANAQLAKCHDALWDYRSQGCWSLVENNFFSGEDVINKTSDACWYILGSNYLRQLSIPDDSGTAQWWDLCIDNGCFNRSCYIVNGPEFGESWDAGWNKGLTNGIVALSKPWPLIIDWANTDLTYYGTLRDEFGETISFHALGDPTGYTGVVQKYLVTFWMDSYGVLKTIKLNYRDGNTEVEKLIVLRNTPREEILDLLTQHHYEACVHTQSTVEDHHEDDHDHN